jgi:hypothetical protein
MAELQDAAKRRRSQIRCELIAAPGCHTGWPGVGFERTTRLVLCPDAVGTSTGPSQLPERHLRLLLGSPRCLPELPRNFCPGFTQKTSLSLSQTHVSSPCASRKVVQMLLRVTLGINWMIVPVHAINLVISPRQPGR